MNGVTLKTVINLNLAIECGARIQFWMPLISVEFETDVCLVIRYWRKLEKCARVKMTYAAVDMHVKLMGFGVAVRIFGSVMIWFLLYPLFN